MTEIILNVIKEFLHEIPAIAVEVFQSMVPLVAVFLLFQFIVLHLRKRAFIRVCIGLLYTFIGLLFFLTGINVGFMPVGKLLGESVANKSIYLLIPIGFALGFVVVMAEPAVQVLNDQVVEVSGGQIRKRSMLYTLAIGVGVAIAMAMVRIVFDFSIWWYIIPGYALSFVLMKFTPNVFTAIAFDSGGVASGPMTATFILAFAIGAADSLGGNVMSNAFGTVAMVAMTPLIAIQIMGVLYGRKSKELEKDYQEMQLEIESSGDEIDLPPDMFDDESDQIAGDEIMEGTEEGETV